MVLFFFCFFYTCFDFYSEKGQGAFFLLPKRLSFIAPWALHVEEQREELVAPCGLPSLLLLLASEAMWEAHGVLVLLTKFFFCLTKRPDFFCFSKLLFGKSKMGCWVLETCHALRWCIWQVVRE